MKITIDGNLKVTGTVFNAETNETVVTLGAQETVKAPVLKPYDVVMKLLIEDGYVYSIEDRRFNSLYGYVEESIMDYCDKEIPEEYIGIVPDKYLVSEVLDEPTDEGQLDLFDNEDEDEVEEESIYDDFDYEEDTEDDETIWFFI